MDWDGGKEDLHHLSQRIQNWTLTLPEFVHADYSIHSKRADHTTTASRRKKNVGYPSLHTHSQCYPNKSQDLLTLRVFKPCMKHPPPPLPKKPTTNITFLWVSLTYLQQGEWIITPLAVKEEMLPARNKDGGLRKERGRCPWLFKHKKGNGAGQRAKTGSS